MAGPLRNQRGSALIIAVMAMLVMGVLSVSFALLADIEARVGVAYKQQAQAEAMAEAALERARDAVRTAPTVVGGNGGFSNWFDGTTANHTLFAGLTLGNTTYSARIDNDCAVANTVPVQIQEPNGLHGGVPNTPCDNTVDNNEVAVITAWATAGPTGQGRSRVRAVVGVDNPWKHVCSNAKPDNNGYCNEPGNRNGSPTVTPSDPNDPNGPQAYDDLPRPILGCSRIAPQLHTLNAAQLAACVNPAPAPAGYAGMQPYPYPTAPGVPRFVLMGDLPGTPGARTCWGEPAGGGNNVYFGYFDCALATYCRAAEPGHVCGGADRIGCLRGQQWWNKYGATLGPLFGMLGPDSRVVHGHANQIAFNPGFTNGAQPLRWGEWVPDGMGAGVENRCWDRTTAINALIPYPVAGVSHGTLANPPGMVYQPAAPNGNVNFNGNLGSQSRQFTVYVHNGSASFGNNDQYYGTFVVEGNEVNNPCSDKDFQTGNGASSQMWAGPNTVPPGPGWTFTNQYGFPIVALIYNPDLPAPTIQPAYAPQGTCADMGSANSEIHGMVYSGGHVQFNPLNFDGTVVAFEIQTQGSATYNYNTWFGNNTPPPGFPFGSGNQVVIIRKSFVVCTNYHDDTTGPTLCN